MNKMDKCINNLKIYAEQVYFEGHINMADDLADIVEYLESLPREPQEWIPCSERLPEQNGNYLVTVGEGKFPPRVFEYKNDEKLYWENEIGCKPNVDYVKAWQPLPEPYKEE